MAGTGDKARGHRPETTRPGATSGGSIPRRRLPDRRPGAAAHWHPRRPSVEILTVLPQGPFIGTVRMDQVTGMAQNEKDNQSAPRERRVVTEQELMEALNRSLWEVERERVQEHGRRPLTP